MDGEHVFRLTRVDFDFLDFLSSTDVASMTATEVGQYLLLLAAEWLEGHDCTLPNDLKVLARLARARRGVSPKVLAKFPVVPLKTARVANPRLVKEWVAAQQRARIAHEKARIAGLKSAENRARSQPQVGSASASSATRINLQSTPEAEAEAETVSGASQDQKIKPPEAAEEASSAAGSESGQVSQEEIRNAFAAMEAEPFGPKEFQSIVASVRQTYPGSTFSGFMEEAISLAKTAGLKVPAQFFKIKRRVEEVEAQQSFRRTPL